MFIVILYKTIIFVLKKGGFMMEGDFKINSFFDDKGEEIEKLLADYLLSLVKTTNFQN